MRNENFTSKLFLSESRIYGNFDFRILSGSVHIMRNQQYQHAWCFNSAWKYWPWIYNVLLCFFREPWMVGWSGEVVVKTEEWDDMTSIDFNRFRSSWHFRDKTMLLPLLHCCKTTMFCLVALLILSPFGMSNAEPGKAIPTYYLYTNICKNRGHKHCLVASVYVQTV